MTPGLPAIATWAICALATAGVIIRPRGLPEALWAVGGAVLLLVSGLLPLAAGLAAVGRGTDVYLFLTGMMLLSETARREGVFDWLAGHAARLARGSSGRLFTLVYGIGTIVTVFLSNDATAVVLTPAVYAVARTAQARPLPLLFACAMIANAASFVLPISNPANLVLYGGRMPALLTWLGSFALPSVVAIAATYLVLRLITRRALAAGCRSDGTLDRLGAGGWLALGGIAATSLVLLVASARGAGLGLPTAIAGAVTASLALARSRTAPWALIGGISWTVLPLVAGLFVLVAALDHTGVIHALAAMLHDHAGTAPRATAAAAGGLVGVLCNLMNNLPAGLIASTAIAQAHPPRLVSDAILIGVDLGPNLSITGSLATILWLAAIRREGADVSFWAFLKVGVVAMPIALAASLAALI